MHDGVRELELDDPTTASVFYVLTHTIYRFNSFFTRHEIALRFALVGRIRIGNNFVKLRDRFSGREVAARLEVSPDSLKIGNLTIMAGAAARRLVASALIELTEQIVSGPPEAA